MSAAAYIDSSYVLAIALRERGFGEHLRRLVEFEELYAANLLEAEVFAALKREGLALDRVTAFPALTWVYPDRALSDEIRQVLQHGYLRGADLWHLACALYLSPDSQDLSFLTLDTRQKRIATKLGFSVSP